MKHYWISIAAMVIFAACDEGPCTKADGPVVSQEITLAAFDRMHMKGAAEVTISKAATQKVIVTAPGEVMPLIETMVVNGLWTFDLMECVNLNSPIQITIEVPDFNSYILEGSGKANIDTFPSTTMQLNIIGSGQIEAGIQAEQLQVSIEGSGYILAGGDADDITTSIEGSGTIDILETTGINGDATIIGSGTTYMNTSQTLDVIIEGSGTVYYKGSPTITTDINGSGMVLPI